MHDTDTQIIQPLQSSRPEIETISEAVSLAHHKVESLMGRDDELIKDGCAPTMPPHSVLEAMIEPYFATINPYFPIWTKERFVRFAIASQHSEDPEQDRAYVMCANNLILITLTATSLRSRSVQQARSSHRSLSSSVDIDLTRTFLTNAKRAIKNIELLLSPRLINVQALLSLVSHLFRVRPVTTVDCSLANPADISKCIIAQEHLSSRLFGILFSLAAQCASSIGLHRWDHAQDQFSEDDRQERQNVSYCLYVLDKAVCWTTGIPPSVSGFDVHITSAMLAAANTTAIDLVAKAKLAGIEETIYADIYSYRATAQTVEQMESAISKIELKLQQWLVESEIDMEDLDQDAQIPTVKLELSIAFVSVRLLLIWPSHERRLERVDSARKCIRLLLRLWQSTLELGQYMVISR